MNKKKALIIDIDGTLANSDNRLKYLAEPKINGMRKAFHDRLSDDMPNWWCTEIIDRFEEDTKIILLTCRPELYRKETIAWLSKYYISYDTLIMRKTNDTRTDWVIKKEVYLNQIKEYYDIKFVIEDRKEVVKMWRKLKLTCLQCDVGEF